MQNNTPISIPLPSIPRVLTRPFVVVNCAASADGKLALPDGRQTRISSEDDMAFVHRLRNWADAVIVGIGTVLKDDPKLTVKEKYVPHPSAPLRVVVDSKCRTPAWAEILRGEAPTLIAVSRKHGQCPEGADIVECGDGRVDLRCLLEHLWERGVKKVLVEGGGTLISSFIDEGLVDEFMIFIGDLLIGGKGPTSVMGKGASDFDGVVRLERYAVFPMTRGVRLHYRVKKEG